MAAKVITQQQYDDSAKRLVAVGKAKTLQEAQKKLSDNGYSVDKPKNQKEGKSSILKNIVGGALETAKGLPKLAATVLEKPTTWAISKGTGVPLEQVRKGYKEQVLDQTMGDKDSTAFKITKGVGDIAQVAAGTSIAANALKGGQVAQGLSKIASMGKVGNTGVSAGKVGLGVAGGVGEQVAYNALADQRLPTKGEAVTAGVVGGAIPLLPLAKSAYKGIKGLATKTDDTVETIAGKIVQGKTKDVQPAIKALGQIDTKGVKTYKDLSSKVGEAKKTVMTTLDDVLAKDAKVYMPEQMVKTVKAGDTVLTQEPVKEALDHLEEAYKAGNDIQNQARIAELKKTYLNGMTKAQQNAVAREYSTQFGDKAFSKTGEPLTSVNAKAYENTRKAVKEIVRQGLDDEAKVLDQKYSDLANTDALVKKMEEKVNALSQKIQKRGLLEKAGRLIGKGVDMATGGIVRSFLTSFLPSNIGNKVLNSLDIEEKLPKLLNMLDEAIKKADAGTLTQKELTSMLPGVGSIGNSAAKGLKEAGKTPKLYRADQMDYDSILAGYRGGNVKEYLNSKGIVKNNTKLYDSLYNDLLQLSNTSK